MKRAFISFDFDHDEDLRNLLAGQAKHSDTPFEFANSSVATSTFTAWGHLKLYHPVRGVLDIVADWVASFKCNVAV